MNGVIKEKGKCDLCGSPEGMLSFGLFKYICIPCQRKANETIKRWNKYLLTVNLGDLPEVIGKRVER